MPPARYDPIAMKRPVVFGIVASCVLASGCLLAGLGQASESTFRWLIGLGAILLAGFLSDKWYPTPRETAEETEARLKRQMDDAFERATNALATQQPVDALNEEFDRAQAEWHDWKRRHSGPPDASRG